VPIYLVTMLICSGMIPKMETLKAGEIGRRREQMSEMFEGFWRACINATDDEHDVHNLKMMGEKSPFVADAIIANPPSFAHVHCAERLGIPLHLQFTFPYSPTMAFPHPLANIKKTNVDPGYTNFMSYPLVEMMTWQGLGDLVNTFRVKTLGLEPVSTLWAPGQLYRLKVPYTYLWSPGLVPKPKDWGPEIDIAGFVFLDLASSFEPPDDLIKFLEAGEPPIYIGFGSIVVDDPERFTEMIFNAVKEAGVRALVSKGWGGLGDDNVPDGIYMLENTPHDWLFPKVKAVVHHGGAGTTAIGLKCGKPTMIVPFFGDQMFWGSMIGNAKAGADPVPYKSLTEEKLAAGIRQLLTDEVQHGADVIAKGIAEEGDGAQNAVKSFLRSLAMRGEHSMRCSILEDRVAVWNLKNTNLRLSALAADILVEQKKLNWKQLRLVRHAEWHDFEGPGEPITGGATALMNSMATVATGLGGIPFKLVKSSKRRQKHEEKKRRKEAQKNARHEKRSGSGSGTIGNGKPISSKPDGEGSPRKHEAKDFANGTAEVIPDAKLEKSVSPHETKIDKHKAPATGSEKATEGADMGQHKVNKEGIPTSPIEKVTSDDVTDGGSIMSADPDQNPTEEVIHDVGEGMAKSGEALAKGKISLLSGSPL
jgi:UDP:flavonoid glycosyltransferase YjiC (YdhE family)